MEERLAADGGVLEGESLETVARLKAAIKDDFLRTFLGLVDIFLLLIA